MKVSMLVLLTLYLDITTGQSRFRFPFSFYPFSFPVYKPASTRSDGDAGYRLPHGLDVIHYVVELTPNFGDENEKKAFKFDGVVKIVVKALQEDIKQIVIHENVRKIKEVAVVDSDGQSVNLNTTVPFKRIKKYNFLRINLKDGETLVNQAHYNITVVYNALVSEDPRTYGLFRGRYKDNDGKFRWYVSSVFEGTYTRKAFPCFDEPSFKSTFDIIVNRPASYASTYSNMKIAEEIPIGDRIKEIFYTTPRMSAYLVSLHISKDFKVIADNKNDTHPFRVIARPNAQGQGDYALKIGPKIIEWLINYLGIHSYTMGEHFNEDHVALPDLYTNAIENWGSIHYREDSLLYDEEENNIFTKEFILEVLTHEIVHKWFGNLVTCQWWDNVWINEGFTSYVELLAMNEIDESLKLVDKLSLDLQRALWIDSEATTTAMQHPVIEPSEIDEAFNGIAYTRASVFLLMLRHFVSENIFRKALNTFLITNAYESAEPIDVYSAFARALDGQKSIPSDIDIVAFMKTWVEQPGIPMINVKIYSGSGIINLQQERFITNETRTRSDQVWSIPLSFTTGADPDWYNLSPSHVMTEKSMDIQGLPGEHWVIFNLQLKGLYRVNYDAQNWQLIIQALKEDLNNIHHLNRAAIVDDVFAFMVSKRMPFDVGFQIIDFLKKETNFFVWNSAIHGFQMLQSKYFFLSDAASEFNQILHTFLTTVINDVGYDVEDNELSIKTENRINILKFACSIGHQGCTNNAVTKFRALRNFGLSVNPNLRSHVYCKGIQEGDYKDWKFLKQLWKKSNNAAASDEMLLALGCTTNKQALQHYLAMVIKIDSGKMLIPHIYLSHPIKVDRGNAIRALEFFKENIVDIRSALSHDFPLEAYLVQLADSLNKEELNDMEQWLSENKAEILEYKAGMDAIKTARKRLEKGWPEADQIVDAARRSDAHSLEMDDLISKGMSVLSKFYEDVFK